MKILGHVIAPLLERVFSFAMLFLASLLFLLLGKEATSQQVNLRYGVVLLVLFLGLFLPEGRLRARQAFLSLPGCALILFLLWLGAHEIHDFLTGAQSGSVWLWFGYAAIFCLFFMAGLAKSNVTALACLMMSLSFILAMISIPPVLDHREPYYVQLGQAVGFWGPWLPRAGFMERFIMPRFAHVNIVGDILCTGVYLGLALALYAVYFKKIAGRNETLYPGEVVFQRGFPFIFLNLTMAGAILSAALLINSRGTVFSVVIAGFFFIAATVIKMRNRQILIVAGLLTGLFLAIGFWGGNWAKSWKEVLTITTEQGQKTKSSYTNYRGAEVARAMVAKNFFWGVGSRNYSKYSTRYDTEWTAGQRMQAYHYTPFSHYRKTLSEEGVGAYLYFAFLLLWGGAVLWGLIRTKSQYKFLLGLAFFCSAVTLLIHGALGMLLQYYASSALLYAHMGLSLAVVHPQFKHDR